MMVLMFFVEVRNANSAVFMAVVGTIIPFPLGRSVCLNKVLEAFLHALRCVVSAFAPGIQRDDLFR